MTSLNSRRPGLRLGSNLRPASTYLICTTRRTGSELLCDVLASIGTAGRPTEFLPLDTVAPWLVWWGSHHTMAEGVAAHTTPNGVFGAKLFWQHMLTFSWWLWGASYAAPGYGLSLLASPAGRALRKIETTGVAGPLHGAYRSLLAHLAGWPASRLGRPENDLPASPADVHRLISRSFPGVCYVFLTRKDKDRQAISLYRAQETEMWHVRARDRGMRESPVEFDGVKIRECLRSIRNEEASWLAFFAAAGVRPLEVTYEGLLADRSATVTSILNHTGLDCGANPPFVLTSDLKRQADGTTDEWLGRLKDLPSEEPRLAPAATTSERGDRD